MQVLAERVRDISHRSDEAARLQRAVEAAVDLVAGCAHAGITVVEKGSVRTAAATDHVVLAGDQLQYELGEGPCLDSIRLQRTVVADDLTSDPRWPLWAPTVHERLGVSAMLSLLLFSDEGSFGSLNLYGRYPQVFDSDDIAVANALATHVGVAVWTGRAIAHRETALITRTVIGQAEGVLMERYRLTPAASFALLQRLSQTTNRKLVDLATELVTTGQLVALTDVHEP
ncbi:GAF domain-containing protein [Auraticoccus monumenti]|uniref:GAF domain-containing protein n=1 Tax=Auraticoccus monumenti TaxID=675864 RepID=A0A1G7DXT8_9ACTN|nr:GAF domain-containing protein [Auraticoccus monumenti]